MIGTDANCWDGGAITGPARSATGSSWHSWDAATGSVAHYEPYANGTGIFYTTELTASIGGKTAANHTYTARACNAAVVSGRRARPNAVGRGTHACLPMDTVGRRKRTAVQR